MLRLSKSNNAHEATNALHKFEELCREYGVAPTEVTADYDPERDEVIAFYYGKKFRKQDASYNLIITAVATYFNGTVVITREDKTATPPSTRNGQRSQQQKETSSRLNSIVITYQK